MLSWSLVFIAERSSREGRIRRRRAQTSHICKESVNEDEAPANKKSFCDFYCEREDDEASGELQKPEEASPGGVLSKTKLH